MAKNISRLSGRLGLKENLFEKLVDSGAETGTPARAKIQELAKDYLLGDAIVYGSASFYDFLKPDHAGTEIYVCSGSACLCSGSQPELKEKLSEHFTPEQIGHMACLGRCHETAAFHYQGKNYSGNAMNDIEAILKGEGNNQDDYYAGSSMDTPILTDPINVKECLELLKNKVLNSSADKLLDDIKASKLRGRGGAGFPLGIKWESCKQVESDEKFMVCNADEGDPGAYSDRYLLEQNPNSVLFGMLVGGLIVGAEHGVLYIRAEYPEAIEITNNAIAEFEREGLIGKDILGSGKNFYFKVVKGAGAYICGEETALLASLEGRRPEVDIRPPFPTQQGLFAKPTVVNNVESFASLPFIIKHGGEAFAQIGTEKSTGSKLLCLDSFFNRPGLYEVEMGTPLKTVINELGQGFKEEVKALHIGGPLGGLVATEHIDKLTVDFESFAQNGYLLGHGSILSIPEKMPIIEYIRHLFEFTADESCGKCFPCRLGSTRGKEMMTYAIDGEHLLDAELVNDLLETMELGSLCALGGGLPLPIKNAIAQFQDELKPYFKEKAMAN